MTGTIARTTPIVDDTPQRFKKCRGTVNLVDDDEFAGLRTQIRVRIIEPTPVGRAFQIEVDRVCFSP